MKDLQNQSGSRREFIKNSARNILIGAVLVTGGVLGWRGFDDSGKNQSGTTEIKPSQSPCSGCAKFNSCGDPQALQTRGTITGTAMEPCPSSQEAKNVTK